MEFIHRRISRMLPKKPELYALIRSLTKKEFIIGTILGGIAVISCLVFFTKLSNRFSVVVPARGGSIIEGVMGTPRFVNPILALSDADKDLVTLVYSGLMRRTSDGDFIPDLAEKYEVSSDGLTYTFTLREKITFHDGSPVTIDDIIYTISSAKDPLIKSPKKVNWDGVSVIKQDERTVIFTLKQRYASFIDQTTIGILPAHLWKDLTPEQFSLSNLNTEAVGSGPYEITKVNRTSSGIPSSYELASFNKFALGEPYIDHIKINFYANEKDLASAWRGGDVDGISAISPDMAVTLENRADVITATLPRVFGLFFNHTQAPLFTDANVIRALDKAIDKDRVIDEVLSGYGTPADGPIPAGVLNDENMEAPGTTLDIEGANALLGKAGWIRGEDGILVKKDKKGNETARLSFSISTSDTAELRKAADVIKDNLAAIGVEVDVKVFETGTLNQNIIRPRKYDALFFGQTINHDTDLFAFWHSSQRNDPGLNIALYTNARADRDLEQATATLDPDERAQLYRSFAGEIAKDMPAIFVYSPKFIYVTDGRADGIRLGRITGPSDRFLGVSDWFVETDRVWKIFVPDDKQ